jgi:hypothetical protein
LAGERDKEQSTPGQLKLPLRELVREALWTGAGLAVHTICAALLEISSP